MGFIADVEGRSRPDLIGHAVEALQRLEHRGARGADARTGDGAGLLFGLPQAIFEGFLEARSGRAPRGPVGVAMVFWDRTDPQHRQAGQRLMEACLERRGLTHLAWRDVPVDPSVLGVKASTTRPRIEQMIVDCEGADSGLGADRLLYAARREFEARARQAGISVYIASMSARTIVYKGLMMASALSDFYPDLRAGWESSMAIFHQRFSTNTFPSWPLAQPFRRLGHNGEINTIVGNANTTAMREEDLSSPLWEADLDYLRPILQRGDSDSAMLDAVVELLSVSGRPIIQVMPMLIPQAWEASPTMSDEVRAFFAYHACVNEPWDGPAAVIYGDGDWVGAHLDRNGLRPLRYQITDDDLVCVSSEVGVLDNSFESITRRGRLGPGHMLAIDLQNGGLHLGDRIKRRLGADKPYQDWLEAGLIRLEQQRGEEGATAGERRLDAQELLRRQRLFGYSREEMNTLFSPMADRGDEPVHSMGDDTPLSVLSKMPRLLPTYFKQRFAQVTNPPIDPIRESSVMSLSIHLGRRHNWLTDGPEHADKVELESPFLSDGDLARLEERVSDRLTRLDCTFSITGRDVGLSMDKRLDALCVAAEEAVDAGRDLLVLSDRATDEGRAPVPMLLAVGAVTTHLLKVGKRLRSSLIVESDEPRDIHHMATLIGYGAGAICPTLALESIRHRDSSSTAADIERYLNALDKGLKKVMSKMGISVLGSYRGAQIFEILGLSQEVVDRCFPHTPSPVGGLGIADLAEEVRRRHRRAHDEEAGDRLDDLGFTRFRRGGETHSWSPQRLGAMNRFRRGDEEAYERFRDQDDVTGPLRLRDLMAVDSGRAPVDLEEVESVAAIRRRFTTAAMSLGALSPEAHEALAVAMNRIGGKSNSGEGGEDPARYRVRDNGDSAESAIKQIASARFGVTPEYVARARELEIKMAQGSKPGEGGQLPSHKVTDYIAGLRHATAGVPLISPPPHHDIYSIEDLAQLIFDLKTVNDRADICVKLVAESGVGTIAAGVAKAYADVILISGHDGGTGASPLSSIKNAGTAWEIGLAEAQQVLRKNGLRERVKLRVDGGLKTGRDVVIGALLGAEEFNFGTAALVALGCRYVRQCHLDTCPVGIATQRGELREKFEGKPEYVVSYFDAVARDIRHLLASMGARTMDEIIGRSDWLSPASISDHPKAQRVDITPLLEGGQSDDGAPFRTWPRNSRAEDALNPALLERARPLIERGRRYEEELRITNSDRCVGGRLAGWIAHRESERRHGDLEGPATGDVELRFRGRAGQSFGAFATEEMTLILEGSANDYVAKGLGGGTVVVRRAQQGQRSTRVGNTVLYGATGGQLFIAGQAGERFAVRNSGARAVVEGVGDHGCEYMTSGTVVVLGETGHNFGAGMTGGQAFVFDPHDRLASRHHGEFVLLERPSAQAAEVLRELIKRHVHWSGSPRAEALLDDFEESLQDFWHVIPRALQQD